MSLKKGTDNITVLAPGRICLFGDHQDYLGLPIIACAIDREIKLKAILNKGHILHIRMPDINEERIIDLQKSFISISNRDYFYTALVVLKRVGCIPNKGYDIEISGTIPVNAGLSSSSAVVVVWIAFLLEAFGSDQNISPEFIADLAFKAEVVEYNSPGGLMDQYTISIGNSIFLNTRDGSYKMIDRKLESLIVGESGVPKQTLGVLKNLKSFALESISSVQAHVSDFKIKNATMEDYDLYKAYVPEHLKPIFYAAIKNYMITKEAFLELSKDSFNISKIGSLMTNHHTVLKGVLKITVPIIDDMIDGALSNGAVGAKIVGSGGGGSIVALTSAENEANVIKGILNAGAKSAYKVDIVNGVRIE